ncbi:MAG: transposase [Fusobacterium varium]|uniref:PBECR3 domain-containing polyvalent protein n=1 Tax=Fusobacterium varium TaxID=856 RepID=UPI00242A5B6A|nr:transposase [Fusobacterium varium]MCF0172087.1 transposase [Fusobacterium varium]MCF0209703.1 transposase [Bacteroidales bacterium]
MEMVGVLKEKIVKTFNLTNCMVYIGEQNIEHMKNSHPDEYEIYYEHIGAIIGSPDYVGENLKDGSLELIKEFYSEEKKCYIKVAVRMSKNGTLFARTLYKLNDKKFEFQLLNKYYVCVKNL